jgi:hypothetical protein
VFLLSSYLGGVVNIQPFLLIKKLLPVLPIKEPFSKQSSGSLVKPFKKKSYAYVSVF